MSKGKVYLIGAGPGDAGLITVKGLECIEQADVIVYDRLVSGDLLKRARQGAETIYVGKGPDRHTLKQEEINSLLVEKARAGNVVARLKGGDPFVFGRGGEEAEVLAENNISLEIIPGITSAVAAPAYAGIPVTHRDYTSAVSIITGNEDPEKDESEINWEHIARGAGTLIFLMGMSNLPGIARKLMQYGRSPATPVALVRWGTWPEQETLSGRLDNIADLARNTGFTNPTVIIVGEVVGLRDKLAWLESKPLFGKRVVVTRSREQASALSSQIATLGGAPVEFPTIKIAPPDDFRPLDEAINSLSSFAWVIFTSVNGVKSFVQRLRSNGKDIRDLKGIKLCAIGPKTRQLLEQYGMQVEYVPSEFKAEQITEGLQDKLVPGERVLLPRADIARRVLPRSLEELGARVTEVTAYKTVVEENQDAARLAEMLKAGQIDVVTFTSSSTVRNFVSMLRGYPLQELMKEVVVACIGPITANTAREAGLTVSVQAGEYTIEGLVKAIVEYMLIH